MKTSYNNVEYAKKVAVLQAQALHVNPPAILFSNMKEDDTEDEEEAPTKKMKIKLDPEDEEADDEMEVRAFLFETGDAESWIKWRIQLDELIRDMPLTTGQK
jgi:hypothetical protein